MGSPTFHPHASAMRLLGTGCKSTQKAKPPFGSEGFHAPVAFNSATTSASLSLREQLYASSRLTVNAIGFQIGFVPANTKILDAYLEASGASDLKSQANPDKYVQYRGPPLQAPGPLISDPGLPSLLSFALGAYSDGSKLPSSLGANAMNSGSAMGYSKIQVNGLESMATQYNLRILRDLSLTAYPSWASPERGLPRPLSSTVPVIARNMDQKDWIWYRSIHSWDVKYSHQLDLFRDMETSDMLVGGQEVTWEQLTNYMRSQDNPALASQMKSGIATYRSSLWFEIPSLLLGVAGAIAYASQPDNPPTWGSVALISGAGLGFAVAWFHHQGRKKTHAAAAAFNATLPGLLQQRAALSGNMDWPK